MCCCYIFPPSLKSFLYIHIHIHNFTYFRLCWVLIAAWACLSPQPVGAAPQVQCEGSSLQSSLGERRLWAPWASGAAVLGSIWGSWALKNRLGFALWHVRSSQARDRAHVSYNGRWIFHHQVTREALQSILMNKISFNVGQIINISFYVLFFFLNMVRESLSFPQFKNVLSIIF